MEYNPPLAPLDILFQDEHLLVVNKPSGLLSVPGRGKEKQDCLISRIQIQEPKALTVHRLDMSTSGLIVIAIGKEIERALSILFQSRKVEKKYIAVVDGEIEEKYGEINLPIITDWPNRPKQKVDFEAGKISKTFYTLLSYDEKNNSSRIELRPTTGRTHQLRIHLKSIKHAIMGDELYAKDDVIKKSNRLLLHAYHISFQHPCYKNKNIDITLEPEF